MIIIIKNTGPKNQINQQINQNTTTKQTLAFADRLWIVERILLERKAWDARREKIKQKRFGG